MFFREHLLKAAIAGTCQHKVAHTPLLLQVQKYMSRLEVSSEEPLIPTTVVYNSKNEG